MTTQTLSLLLALGATLCFSSASLIYADYSKRVSVLWMNCFKALVCFLALIVTIPAFVGWHKPSAFSLGGFLLSGLVGLNIADLFLLNAFTRLGVGRTLILFGFQPLFVGIGAALLFGQPMNPERFLAVIFLVACLFTFSLERYKMEKRWEIGGLVHALLGVALDTCGILLTRASFGDSPQVTPLEGNFWRSLGAILGFMAISYFRPIRLWERFRATPPKNRRLLVLAAFGGTFISLSLYLSAVKVGHLASIASIAITGPMFATSLECLVHRKAPSRYLLVAFGFFCAGFYILLNVS